MSTYSDGETERELVEAQARVAELDYLLAEVIPHITGTRETLRTILERRRNELARP